MFPRTEWCFPLYSISITVTSVDDVVEVRLVSMNWFFLILMDGKFLGKSNYCDMGTWFQVI